MVASAVTESEIFRIGLTGLHLGGAGTDWHGQACAAPTKPTCQTGRATHWRNHLGQRRAKCRHPPRQRLGGATRSHGATTRRAGQTVGSSVCQSARAPGSVGRGAWHPDVRVIRAGWCTNKAHRQLLEGVLAGRESSVAILDNMHLTAPT